MHCLVLGTAKSGTTALLSLIAQAMEAPLEFFEQPLATVLPGLRAHAGDAVAKVIFSHEREAAVVAAAPAFDHRVVLSRDPRDLLVSSALYSLANQPTKLADDVLLDRLVALVHAKQAEPSSVDFCDIARVLDKADTAFVDGVLQQQVEYARFVAGLDAAWHVLRYEDLVAGRLGVLSDHLGLRLRPTVKVAPEYARVERTRSAGDWRHWFTERDVAALRPLLDPLLQAHGYAIEWDLAPTPRIAPEHSWRYLERLIDERREHHRLPPRAVVESPACNLCGGRGFGPGPAQRMAINGRPPRCLGCDSLERQRVVRRMLQAMPLGFLDWRHVLQFSPDNGLPEAVFRHVDTRPVAGGAGLQSLSYGNVDIDLVAFCHLFEYLQDDRESFSEMARRLSPRGFMLACFATPGSRERTLESTKPAAGGLRRLYGRDVAAHFRCAELGLTTLVIEQADPCTGAQEVVHLFFKSRDDAARVGRWLLDGVGEAGLLLQAGAAGAVAVV